MTTRVPGLFFAGSSTLPGVGVPMVLLSGKLAAQRVATTPARRRPFAGERRLDLPVHLVPAYRACETITRTRSSSYYLATRLLPVPRRPYVHALYAFARVADDLVDHLGDDPGHDRDHDPADALADFRSAFGRAVGGEPADQPALAAIAHTIDVWDLPVDAFDRFFRSMEMDLTSPRTTRGTTSSGTWTARRR